MLTNVELCRQDVSLYLRRFPASIVGAHSRLGQLLQGSRGPRVSSSAWRVVGWKGGLVLENLCRLAETWTSSAQVQIARFAEYLRQSLELCKPSVAAAHVLNNWPGNVHLARVERRLESVKPNTHRARRPTKCHKPSKLLQIALIRLSRLGTAQTRAALRSLSGLPNKPLVGVSLRQVEAAVPSTGTATEKAHGHGVTHGAWPHIQRDSMCAHDTSGTRQHFHAKPSLVCSEALAGERKQHLTLPMIQAGTSSCVGAVVRSRA